MNTFGYVGGNPLYWVDPYGLAQVCRRKLDNIPKFKIPGLFDADHAQIFYDDGTNSGFFDDNEIRSDTGHDRSEYTCSSPSVDDDKMRAAEMKVQKNWDMNWTISGNNCHNYTDAVMNTDEMIQDRIKPVGGVNIGP